MSPKQIFLISWLLVALYIILKIAMSAGVEIPGGVISALLSFFFLGVLLCVNRYGKKDALIFFVVAFVIGWLYETCSILTGFPFGHYHYSDVMGFKLGFVPVTVMLLYFAMGFMSWSLAHILLGKYDNAINRKELLVIPLLSSFMMVIWDVCMDPLNGTIGQWWVWHDGGPYFGVPLSNFFGWFLFAFTFYLIFAFYQYRKATNPTPEVMTEKTAWLLPIAGYLSAAFAMPLSAIFGKNYLITSPDGHVWWTSDICWSMTLITIFTMFFIVVLALIRLNEYFVNQENKKGSNG
jgi:putative membrane protein